MSDPGPSSVPDPADAGRQLAGWIALLFAGGMHLVVGVFVASSAAVAPVWAVVLLAAGWLGFGLLLLWWHRRRPLATLLVPFAAAGLWWAGMALGTRLLGWSD